MAPAAQATIISDLDYRPGSGADVSEGMDDCVRFMWNSQDNGVILCLHCQHTGCLS